MKLFVLFSLLIAALGVVASREHEFFKLTDQFREFKQYLEFFELEVSKWEDFLKRFEIYLQNKRYIMERNRMNLGFTLGVTRFTHWTNEEYRSYLKTSSSASKRIGASKLYVPRSDIEIRDIDYRNLGAVTKVKDQGYCGSCWAFSTTGCLESQYLLKTKKNITLSEQELVDCSGSEGNEGCNGGMMEWAFEYVKKNGLTTSNQYPYTAEDGKCQASLTSRNVFVNETYFVQSGNEDDLALALIEHGPIAVGIDAGSYDFQLYQSGIYTSDECSSEDLDHGVLLVGIGSHPSPYYIVKNSWGADWGDHGYILMARNRNNMCGIATDSSVASIYLKTE